MGACGLLIVVGFSIVGAQEPAPVDAGAIERVESVRKLLTVRLDPKPGSRPGECERLAAGDVAVAAGGVPARVTAVERVPAPERHWLLIDTSGSAEGARREAKRSAARYIRELLGSSRHRAAVVAIDEDAVLIDGPTSDVPHLLDRVESIAPGGQSLLIDGLEDVLRQVEGDRREHLIVYWTDGIDTASLSSRTDLLERIERASNATVFPLAIVMAAGSGPVQPPDRMLFDAARVSGGEVLGSHDPRWLDRIRGWLDRRFVVSVVPPERAAGTWTVRAPSKRCEVTVVHDALPAGSGRIAGGPPASWIRTFERIKTPPADAACARRGWERPWISRGRRLEGCLLDLVADRGILYSSGRAGGYELLAPPEVAARAVTVEVPPLDSLPESAEAMLERWLDLLERESADGRSKHLVGGRTLFTQQSAIARAVYAAFPDYRGFAAARLEREARVEIDALARTLRAELGTDDAAAALRLARDGRVGRSYLAAAKAPTDADLRKVLAAWLGDVPANELFRRWERRLIAARLAGDGGDPLPRWRRARGHLALPTSSRLVAPLIPVRDRGRDLVGFYRILLPRASWIVYRERSMHDTELPYDFVPERPYGLWLLDALMAAHPALGPRLAALRCTLDDLEYVPSETWRQSTEHPWHAMRVRLDLACSPGAIAPDGFLSLAAELEVDRDEAARIVRGTDVGLLLGKEP